MPAEASRTRLGSAQLSSGRTGILTVDCLTEPTKAKKPLAILLNSLSQAVVIAEEACALGCLTEPIEGAWEGFLNALRPALA